MAQDFKLDQTKGTFKLRGVVTRIEKDNAYTQGTVKNGKNKGAAYRSIRFGVRTSDENEVFVELFGMDDEYCYFFRRENKEKKIKKDTKKVKTKDRNKDQGTGYDLVGVNLQVMEDEEKEGKFVRETEVPFEAVKAIHLNVEDGDAVYITGKVEFSTYNDKDQTKYIVGSLFKQSKEIDFEDDDFEETANFEQEIIFVSAEDVKKENKVYVQGYTIGYADSFHLATFTIDKEALPTLAKNFLKKIKFGDFIKVFGDIVNRVEIVEVEDKDAAKNEWGGKRPKSYDRNTVRNYISELQISDVDSDTYIEGKYTAEDFVVEEFIEEEDEDEQDNKGGKGGKSNPFKDGKGSKGGKNNKKDDFEDDEDEDEDESDDDDEDEDDELPWK